MVIWATSNWLFVTSLTLYPTISDSPICDSAIRPRASHVHREAIRRAGVAAGHLETSHKVPNQCNQIGRFFAL